VLQELNQQDRTIVFFEVDFKVQFFIGSHQREL
jgi:hypothetical protein